MRLKGKNFQPWAEFDLEIDGLTVLVGPSNKGKSALFRALKGVLRNEIPAEFVRNGQEDPLEIELEVDGHHIKATRSRKGTTKYEVDGKKFTSLGGKIPDEIEKLKFGEVHIGDYSLDPIFAGQNKAQFLIDSDRWKPNELNAILGAFSNTEKLDAGKKEANLRISQRKSEASTLATEIRGAEERLIQATEKQVRAQEVAAAQIGSALFHRGRYEPLQEILDSLTLPDLTDLFTLLRKAQSSVEAAVGAERDRFYRTLVTAQDDVVAGWTALVTKHKTIKAVTDLIELRDKPSAQGYIDKLEATQARIDTDFVEAKSLNARIAQLAEAAATCERSEKLTSELEGADNELAEAEVELEQVRALHASEVARKEAEVARKEAASKLCPKCGKTLEHVCQ
jgi:energy-coupling factor transporter ATP-binding protein EcfA2